VPRDPLEIGDAAESPDSTQISVHFACSSQDGPRCTAASAWNLMRSYISKRSSKSKEDLETQGSEEIARILGSNMDRVTFDTLRPQHC